MKQYVVPARQAQNAMDTLMARKRCFVAPSLCGAMSLAPFLVIAAASLAHADSTSETLSEISRCSGIADAAARLRCYDMAAPRAKEALLPNPQDFGKPAPPSSPAEVAQVTAVVREFSRTAHGRAVFVLDNGQTWRQLDADNVAVQEPDPGKALNVTISRGLFGSYNLAIEGRNGVIKVHRLQ
jgi:hypothetical protein